MSALTPEAEHRIVDPGHPVHVAQLEGVRGSLGIQIAGEAVGTIRVDDGQVSMSKGEGTPDALLIASDRADVQQLASGALNPIVAAIQGRAAIRGDLELALRIILALNAARSLARAPTGG